MGGAYTARPADLTFLSVFFFASEPVRNSVDFVVRRREISRHQRDRGSVALGPEPGDFLQRLGVGQFRPPKGANASQDLRGVSSPAFAERGKLVERRQRLLVQNLGSVRHLAQSAQPSRARSRARKVDFSGKKAIYINGLRHELPFCLVSKNTQNGIVCIAAVTAASQGKSIPGVDTP
jgi:hypothetical protein